MAGINLSMLHWLLACSEKNGAKPYAENIGIQLYTVRDQLAADPQSTLEEISKLGYKQIELMDTDQIPLLKPIAKDLGLAINSSFFSWSVLTGRWDLREEEDRTENTFDQVLEDAQKAGLNHLVFGYMLPEERSTLDDYRRICPILNEAGEKCKSAGIQLCYHNHSFEFAPMEGSNGYDILIEKLDPELVKFELDVFWSDIAGVNPVALMKKLSGRIRLLHLKDKLINTPVIYDEGKVPEEAFKELGNGVVDLEGVLATAGQVGVEHCMVEQDQSPAPLESIKTSLVYMKG